MYFQAIPMSKTTWNILQLQLRISYIHLFAKARAGQSERGGQKMKTHYKVHNLKKEAFSNMNYASHG